MVKPLTAAEFQQSVAEDFSAAVEATCQDLIKAAVLAEREACAVEADKQAEDEPYGHAKFRCANIAAAIRARSQA